MRTRIILLVVLGLIFAGAATFLVLKRTATTPPQQVAATEHAGPATIDILVAQRDLPSGAIIGPTDVRVVPWPRSGLPEGGMAPNSIEFGQTVVRLPIARNSPVLQNQIISKGEGGHLAYLLEGGRVAATIAVTEVAGVAGHVAPGDYVDVLFTQSLGESMASTLGVGGSDADAAATETLLVRIKVIATDQRLDDINTEAYVGRTVTLEVSSKEAEILALAQEIGALSLALNSATQPEEVNPDTVLEVRRGPIKSFTLDNDISPLLQFARATKAAADREAAIRESALQNALHQQQEGAPVEEEEPPHVVIIIRGAAAEEVSVAPAPALRGNGAGPGKSGDPSGGPPDEDVKEAAAEDLEADPDEQTKAGKPSPIERGSGGDARQ